jgi:nicotinate phosphoribosyltransferase
MIINSLLDTDFYKFTQGQIVFNQFSSYSVKYKFKCRNEGIRFTKDMVEQIKEEIRCFCSLRFTADEINYLKTNTKLKKSYLEFLRLYKPDISHFNMELDKDGNLNISILGPWFLTIYWEVPLLAIINEVYTRNLYPMSHDMMTTFLTNLQNKIGLAKMNSLHFSDFGTRRRFSFKVQDIVNSFLKEETYCVGTSNVFFAKQYGMKPIGTMAHEFICAGQGSDKTSIQNSQKYMLQKWVDEFRGDYGIALTDTLGLDKFFKDFDGYFARVYDGVRQDSGDPFEVGNKVIAHYKKLGINPETKTLVFSDGLTMEKAVALNKMFGGKIELMFGIGTNLTNDFHGVTPLQIVVKMVQCNGKHVAKISDTPAKAMCESSSYVSYLKSII